MVARLLLKKTGSMSFAKKGPIINVSLVCFPVVLQQGGDKNSSHSSSNTLSSNASSSNSDEKHFGSGDLMDPEMLGLTYIKGASTDSGIDTAPCSMTPGAAGASVSRVMLQGHGVSDPGHRWTPELAEEESTEEDHSRLYLPQSYAAALATGHAPADGSMGDLSESSSHSRWAKERELMLMRV